MFDQFFSTERFLDVGVSFIPAVRTISRRLVQEELMNRETHQHSSTVQTSPNINHSPQFRRQALFLEAAISTTASDFQF